MLAKDAKQAAREWVADNAGNIPGFRGALLHGSLLGLGDGDTIVPSSDIDILVVIDDSAPGTKLGKFVYRGALLDVTQVSLETLDSAEKVLEKYHLAGSFVRPYIMSDRTGHLSILVDRVSRDFAKRQWVIRRCDDARDNALGKIRSLDKAKPLHDQVTSWLFATGVLTHLPLVAGLRNPTVRKRYVAVRDLLEEYDLGEFYEKLLNLLGCESMPRKHVEHHLAALADAFDAASNVIRTPVFFASDLTKAARPVAIDGSREMIADGDHREAIFWIVATWCRCMHVFHVDASELEHRFGAALGELLDDLGITSTAEIQRRTARTEAFIPEVCRIAEQIVAANPEIEA